MFGVDDELSRCETVLSEGVEYVGGNDHLVVRKSIESASDEFSDGRPCTVRANEVLSTNFDLSLIRLAYRRNTILTLLNPHHFMVPQHLCIPARLQMFQDNLRNS